MALDLQSPAAVERAIPTVHPDEPALSTWELARLYGLETPGEPVPKRYRALSTVIAIVVLCATLVVAGLMVKISQGHSQDPAPPVCSGPCGLST
jgi:hypothetical protein